MNLFKLKISLLIVVFCSVLLFFYFAFNDTTWGGWSPPDISLKLNKKETKWVENFEKKYKGTYDYIGLDKEFTEDSIIYLNFNCHNRSIFENNQVTDKETFTKEVCKKFLSNSKTTRTQKYVKFSYYNFREKNKKHRITLDFLYCKDLDRIEKLK